MENQEIMDEGKQYIVVKLGCEQYGIDIKYVDNIVRMQRITRVPKAQPYFKGVINLRGEIMPVMSIRLKFNLDDDEITKKSRIIIIKTEQQALVGNIVDEVKEVVTLMEDQVEKVAYEYGKDDLNSYLVGVGKYNNELISLLNINGVISEQEKGEN